MRRSKLEMYIDVLQVLAHHGPLKLTHVMYKANINCSVLTEFMDLLIEQNLVVERTVAKKRVVYAITQKGRSLIKVFREISQLLPVREEGKHRIPLPY